MSKNLFLISLATITLAATAFTNIASSRADSVSIVGSGNSSSSPKLTVEPPPKNTPADGRCAGPEYSVCGYPSNPSPATPAHSLPYPSYPSPVGNIYIPQYPYLVPVSGIPVSPFPYSNSPKSEPPVTQPGDCIDCVYGTSAK